MANITIASQSIVTVYVTGVKWKGTLQDDTNTTCFATIYDNAGTLLVTTQMPYTGTPGYWSLDFPATYFVRGGGNWTVLILAFDLTGSGPIRRTYTMKLVEGRS